MERGPLSFVQDQAFFSIFVPPRGVQTIVSYFVLNAKRERATDALEENWEHSSQARKAALKRCLIEIQHKCCPGRNSGFVQRSRRLYGLATCCSAGDQGLECRAWQQFSSARKVNITLRKKDVVWMRVAWGLVLFERNPAGILCKITSPSTYCRCTCVPVLGTVF